MPISVRCPNCQSKLNAPDAAAGRRVKCPKCQTPIAVPAESGGSGPVPTPAPSAAPPLPPPPAQASGSPFDFSSPEPPALPAEPAAAAPAASAGSAFDFDAAADAGAGQPARASSGPRKAPRPVEDEDTDEPPRRGGRRPPKGPPPDKKSGSPLVIILVVVGFLFLGCCVGVPLGAYYFFKGKVEDLRQKVEEEQARAARNRPPLTTAEPGSSAPDGWTAYSPPSGTFKAYFPGEVDEGPSQPISSANRKVPPTLPKVYDSAAGDDSVQVKVAVLPFDPKLSPLDRENAMGVMLKRLVEGAPGKSPTDEGQKGLIWLGKGAKETVYGVPGPGGGKLIARQAIVGDHGYISVLALKNGRKKDVEEAFFNSFEATAK